MVGGVTHRLLHQSEIPVVVVPFGATPATPVGGTTLVVGVGHGPATGAALEWAAAFARERDLGIELVHAVNHQPLFLPSRTMEQALEKAAERLDPALLTEWAETDLAAVVAHLKERPGMDTLAITTRVEFGATGPSLVTASRSASMLVIGKRSDGPFTGYFTSAALHHVLTHGRVPVVVVPQPHDRH
jgi:nucleotide-binding universal stress UspA family protein